MPGGRPQKQTVPIDASCLSLALSANIQCITCKRERRQPDGCCKKPWDDYWLNTTKESDYIEAWDVLQKKNYRVPQSCRNARNRIKRNTLKEKGKNERSLRVSKVLSPTREASPPKRESILAMSPVDAHPKLSHGDLHFTGASPSSLNQSTPIKKCLFQEPSQSPTANTTSYFPTTPKEVFNVVKAQAATPSKLFHKIYTTPSKLFRKISTTMKSMLEKYRHPSAMIYGLGIQDSQRVTKNNTTETPFPLLESLKIPTSFESPLNEMKIQNILREMVNLHKANDRDITFTWANGRPACMGVIERVKNREYFTKMNRDWIMKIVSHMNPNNVGEAATCLCSWLQNKFKKQYEDVAKKAGLVRFKKLNAVQLTAALDEANITHNSCNIFMRHFNHHLGVRLVEPLSKVVELGKYSHQVDFGEAKIEKEKGKKEEIVEYFTMDLCEVLAADLERLLNDPKNKLTKFGYERDGKMTVDVVGGCDHGQGASRFVSRINLLPSSERRKSGRIDTGSRQITFAKTVCKKDTYEILNLTAAKIRASFKRVKESMFLAVKDDEGVVSVKIVEKRHHFDTDRCWVVIPGFTLFICGDLAYYALAMGRDGSAGCRCPYCHLVLREFDDEDKEGLPLTLEQLNKCATAYQDPEDDTDTLGVKYTPMLQEPNSHYIPPILHCQIGAVNKVLTDMLDFIDQYVQHLPNVERGRRKKLREETTKLEALVKEVSQLNIDKKAFTKKRIAANVIVKEKTNLVKELRKTLKQTDLCPQVRVALADTIKALQEEISEQRKIFEENRDLASYIVHEYNEKEGLRLRTSKIVAKLKKICTKLRKSRKGDKEGLETLIEDIMRLIACIKPEAYHGGALNGMSCQRLLAASKEIMKRVSDLCLEMFKQRTEDEGYEMITEEGLTLKFILYSRIFEVLDVVFALLRKPDPTNDEILELERMLKVLESLWRQAKLSIIVKMHILFKHTVDKVKAFGGIADKVEDFVEKAHQEGRKHDDLTKRMAKHFRKKQEVQLNRQWAALNPTVQAMKMEVAEASRRTKRKGSEVETVTTKKRQAKLARREATSVFYTTHFVTHLTSHL